MPLFGGDANLDWLSSFSSSRRLKTSRWPLVKICISRSVRVSLLLKFLNFLVRSLIFLISSWSTAVKGLFKLTFRSSIFSWLAGHLDSRYGLHLFNFKLLSRVLPGHPTLSLHLSGLVDLVNLRLQRFRVVRVLECLVNHVFHLGIQFLLHP